MSHIVKPKLKIKAKVKSASHVGAWDCMPPPHQPTIIKAKPKPKIQGPLTQSFCALSVNIIAH